MEVLLYRFLHLNDAKVTHHNLKRENNSSKYINQTNNFNGSFIQNNKHLFAVFDLQMNFKQYSELFSFANEKNEFCKSFIYKDDELIIGYGVSNKECYIAKYDFEDLRRSIRWFNN